MELNYSDCCNLQRHALLFDGAALCAALIYESPFSHFQDDLLTIEDYYGTTNSLI